MTCAHNGAYAMEAQPQEPPIPGHPTSDKDCDVWGQQLDEYWENKVLKCAREGDADCKSISKDPSEVFADQPCGNVVDAKVSYKFCDREDYFRQCFAKQKESGLRQCRERLPKSTRGRSTLPAPILNRGRQAGAPDHPGSATTKRIDTRGSSRPPARSAGSDL